jgi:type I restriction enzyme M protein
MIATTNKTGMVGVAMPHGGLFRGGAEGEIRAGILKEDMVEAIVGLPSNLFYETGIPASILIPPGRGRQNARPMRSSFRRPASSAKVVAHPFQTPEAL